MIPPLRLIAWEATRACNLACKHCRAEACSTPYPGELSEAEARDLIRQIGEIKPSPIFIITGGEPLMRENILSLASYASSLGIRTVMSPNGTLVGQSMAKDMKKAGISRVSLSLDAPDEKSHDYFRGVKGSYQAVLNAAENLKSAGLDFQINSTLTADNIDQFFIISELAEKIGAVAHHIFLLVPVGRGKDLENSLSANDYEKSLRKIKNYEGTMKIEFKATCAPQYNRISRQLGMVNPRAGRGCLGGQGFIFISHRGQVQACGYLPIEAGNIRKQSLKEIYEQSNLFLDLRDKNQYNGKCGKCEYWQVCGGCRARSHAKGDHLGPEPLCPYNNISVGTV